MSGPLATPNTDDAFRVVGSEQVCDVGFVSVERLQVAGPDGAILERHVVRHPGAVVVVPIEGDAAILVRQYRAATDSWLLEVPAGKRDVEGEPPEDTARRELEEEIGRRVGTLTPLCRFYNSPGFTDERTHLFLATDLEECDRAAVSPEEELMTLEHVPLDAVRARIAAGEIDDAKSIIGLLLALEHLRGASG